jgi:hypothetical protein
VKAFAVGEIEQGSKGLTVWDHNGAREIVDFLNATNLLPFMELV